MEKNTNKNYREVKIDNDGMGFEKHYTHPLTKRFQYEYALYQVVSTLFASAQTKSRRLDSLKLYFKELPLKKGQENGNGGKKKSQEEVLEEMKALVTRDVIGSINFTMMNECAVEVLTKEESDGSNSIVFTDGVYGFMLRLDMPDNKHPKRIEVRNKRRETEGTDKTIQTNKDAALKGAA